MIIFEEISFVFVGLDTVVLMMITVITTIAGRNSEMADVIITAVRPLVHGKSYRCHFGITFLGQLFVDDRKKETPSNS